jgi:hypothetical protein
MQPQVVQGFRIHSKCVSSFASICRADGGFELSLRAPTGALGRSVHFVRGTPAQFAAILPGDGVAEVVLTSGLNSFL